MKNILLARIDSRLSHGKVVSEWTDNLALDTVIIANDRLANDKFEQSIMNLTIPKEIEAYYLELDLVKSFIEKNKNKKIFLITESASDLDKIISQDILVEKVNIGIIHLSFGKKLLTEEVAVDENDLEIFSNLIDKGVEVFIQVSPYSIKRNLSEFFVKS